MVPWDTVSLNKQTETTAGNNCTTVSRSGRYTLEFDQGHVTKNQPITVLVFVSERLGI